MSPCKCEYVEEVNAIQSGVRIQKLVKKCAECEERDTRAQEEAKQHKIMFLEEQIKLLEVDKQSAITLGYQDVVEKKQELIDMFKKQLEGLKTETSKVAVEVQETEIPVETSKKRTRKKKNE